MTNDLLPMMDLCVSFLPLEGGDKLHDLDLGRLVRMPQQSNVEGAALTLPAGRMIYLLKCQFYYQAFLLDSRAEQFCVYLRFYSVSDMKSEVNTEESIPP